MQELSQEAFLLELQQGNRRGRKPMYPYDVWISPGKRILLKRGEDYLTEPDTMRANMSTWARRHGFVIKTHITGSTREDLLLYTFTEDEAQAELLLDGRRLSPEKR